MPDLIAGLWTVRILAGLPGERAASERFSHFRVRNAETKRGRQSNLNIGPTLPSRTIISRIPFALCILFR